MGFQGYFRGKDAAAVEYGAIVQRLIDWGEWLTVQDVGELGYPLGEMVRAGDAAPGKSIVPDISAHDRACLEVNRAIKDLRGDLSFSWVTMLCYLRDCALQAQGRKRGRSDAVLEIMAEEPDCRNQSLGFFLNQFYSGSADMEWWASHLGVSVQQAFSLHDAGIHLISAMLDKRSV